MACDHVVRLTFSSPDPMDDALMVRCDPDLLEAMVSNLVRNAIRFSPRSGQVHIGIKRMGSEVAVTVDDDGPGLAPEARQEVLTQRGRRLDESKPGSGLGLSIVSDLAHLYLGRLELGTAPLGGLRVELVLPAGEA
jgi:signal transduction histidine kinase